MVTTPTCCSGPPVNLAAVAVYAAPDGQTANASVNEEPIQQAPEGPLVPAAPDVSPTPAEPPPGTLPGWLNRGEVSAIAQVHDVARDWDDSQEEVQALAYADAAGGHVCIAVEQGRPTCWDMPFQPSNISVLALDRDGTVRVTLGRGLDGYVLVTVTNGNLVATEQHFDDRPPRRLEGTSAGVAPPFFSALRGHEMATSRTTLIARVGASLTVCRRPPRGAFACTEPQQFAELEAAQIHIEEIGLDPGGVLNIVYGMQKQKRSRPWRDAPCSSDARRPP